MYEFQFDGGGGVPGGNALAVCSNVAPTMVLSMVLSYYTMVLSYMCSLLKCSL